MRYVLPTILLAAVLAPGAASAQQTGAAVVSSTKPIESDQSKLLGIVDATSAAEISTATMASRQAARQDVKDYAAMILRDHKVSQQEARDLGKKLNIMAAPLMDTSPVKRHIDNGGPKLSTLNPEQFDRAYLENQVALHQAAIDAVTAETPGSHPEIKAFVEKVKPVMENHLRAAQDLLNRPPK